MTTIAQRAPQSTTVGRSVRRPRLGFLGVGWIGRHRLQAVVESELADVAAIADASTEAVRSARELAPRAEAVASFEELLGCDLDGIVIATPSALHAEQSIAALERGMAVFCQKPLARTAAETRSIIEAARRADRLLAVDLSYRHVRGVAEMRELLQSGSLGDVFLAELTFHNAYGPDKPWFFDPRLSGGGCLIDLGTHLVDLALWMFDFPRFGGVHSRMYRQGQRLASAAVEDCALAEFNLFTDSDSPPREIAVRLACSWNLPAGQDAVINAVFYGTRGAVALSNVNGSFYDFTVEHWNGRQRERLAAPPDAWGGRAAVEWTRRLAEDPRFDPAAEHLIEVATLLDAIYGRS